MSISFGLKMKLSKIILFLLLFLNFEIYSQLLPVPCAAYRVDKTWYVADEMGNVLYTSTIILDVETYSEELLSGYAFDGGNVVSVYYNNFGEVELKTPSQKAFGFKNNRAFIIIDTSKNAQKPSYLYGIIDKQGRYITPMKWIDIEEFSEGLAYVMNPEERGYIDTSGKFAFKLDSAFGGYGFSEGLTPISDARIDRFGFMDRTGKLVIGYNFFEAGLFFEGLARVFIPNKEDGRGGFGFVNKNGKLVINNFFDETRIFSEGYNFVAIVGEKNITKWCIIDKDGVSKTDFVFGEGKDFSESIAAVRELYDTMWYYIDTNFKKITDKYKFCGSFKNGKALVVDVNDRKYYINKDGKILFELPPNADIILDTRTNEKYGKYDNK